MIVWQAVIDSSPQQVVDKLADSDGDTQQMGVLEKFFSVRSVIL
jgi:hypothetical protein